MAYIKQIWQNGPQSNTPLSASRLGYMETGIQNASNTADTALAQVNEKVTYSDLSLAVDPIRTQSFGGPSRTVAPFVIVYRTGQVTNLAAATDYVLTAPGVAAYNPSDSGMAVLGTTTASPVEIVVPIAGRYMFELQMHFTGVGAGQFVYGSLILNRTTAESVGTGVLNKSFWRGTGVGTSEGAHMTGLRIADLGAGARVQFAWWSTVGPYTAAQTVFGNANSQIVCRYLSPVNPGV